MIECNLEHVAVEDGIGGKIMILSNKTVLFHVSVARVKRTPVDQMPVNSDHLGE